MLWSGNLGLKMGVSKMAHTQYAHNGSAPPPTPGIGLLSLMTWLIMYPFLDPFLINRNYWDRALATIFTGVLTSPPPPPPKEIFTSKRRCCSWADKQKKSVLTYKQGFCAGPHIKITVFRHNFKAFLGSSKIPGDAAHPLEFEGGIGLKSGPWGFTPAPPALRGLISATCTCIQCESQKRKPRFNFKSLKNKKTDHKTNKRE